MYTAHHTHTSILILMTPLVIEPLLLGRGVLVAVLCAIGLKREVMVGEGRLEVVSGLDTKGVAAGWEEGLVVSGFETWEGGAGCEKGDGAEKGGRLESEDGMGMEI